METIEIRHKKKQILLVLALMISGGIGGLLYFFLSGLAAANPFVAVILIFLNILMIVQLYPIAKRAAKNNEPYLVLTANDISINDQTPSCIQWDQITSWSFEEEENTHYLILQMGENTKKITISLLDKKAWELEELMNSYKNANSLRS